jgi:hypothetical protein
LKKHNHTAERIFDRLVCEKSFKGSYSSVPTAVGSTKGVRSVPPQCMVPLSSEPREAVQIDWDEVTIYEQEKKTKLYILYGR